MRGSVVERGVGRAWVKKFFVQANAVTFSGGGETTYWISCFQ